ncbi:fibronectin type III domain-containing protein [Candidatus Gottesmanbacteria bacterium]|nr:fibronectin type III domain-containing protein [Candidatus Gottesmanbacteria bacterium]
MKHEPHIPTIIALIIMVFGFGSLIFLTENATSLLTRASGDASPKEVTLSNITDTSFTISWVTDLPAVGLVKYRSREETLLSRAFYDIRDTEKSLSERQIHFVSASSLKPSTTYDISIVSGSKTFTDPRYAVTTGLPLPPPEHEIKPTYGTIRDSSDQPTEGVLVYTSFDGSQTLAVLSDTHGNWVLPLGTLRSQDGSRYFIPTKTDIERFFFVGDNGRSIVTTTAQNNAPLPPVQLGESYDFSKIQGNLPQGLIIAQAESFSKVLGTVNADFQVLMPTTGAFIPSGRPVFKGTGMPGKNVIITLSGPSLITEKVKVADNSSWSWVPKNDLTPGKYSSTFTSVAQDGTPTTRAAQFTILKSGTSVLGEATASASVSPSPRASASASASLKPSPSLKVSPAATPTPPPTGSMQPTLIIGLIGAASLLFGIIALKIDKLPH